MASNDRGANVRDEFGYQGRAVMNCGALVVVKSPVVAAELLQGPRVWHQGSLALFFDH